MGHVFFCDGILGNDASSSSKKIRRSILLHVIFISALPTFSNKNNLIIYSSPIVKPLNST